MSDQSAVVLENKKTFARCRNQLLVLSLAMLMVVQSIGCSSVSKLGVGEALTVAYRDLVWARRAFNLRYGNCQRPYAEHFQNGFCAGYIDMCNGGDGYVPALPPSEYRGAEFQSVDGAQCVNSWFEGFPAGVAAAKQDKAGDFHDIMISRMVNSAIEQEKIRNVLPADIPIVNGRNTAPRAAFAKKTPTPPQSPNPTPLPIPQPPIVPPIETAAQTELPPIISSDALSISPTEKTNTPLEPIKTEVPKIVPASYGAVKQNTPLPSSIADRPWTSSRN